MKGWLCITIAVVMAFALSSGSVAQSRGSTSGQKKSAHQKSTGSKRKTTRSRSTSTKSTQKKPDTGQKTTTAPKSQASKGAENADRPKETAKPAAAQEDKQPEVEKVEDYAAQPLRRLFNGKDLTGWRLREPNGKNTWKVENGVLINEGQGTDLVTDDKFSDCELHLEFNVPAGGNSGVYLQGRYEIQICDSAGQTQLTDSMLGAIYGKVAPAKNPAKPAGEWQTLDVHFQQAVRDTSGKVVLKPVVTIILNDEIIADRVEIDGVTGGALDTEEGTPGPLMLQGDHTAVQYRNILLRPLPPRKPLPAEEEVKEVPPPPSDK